MATSDHSGGLTITMMSPGSQVLPLLGNTWSAITFAPLDTQPAITGGATITNVGSDIQWFAHSDALPQFAPVPSVVTDISAPLAGTHGGDLIDTGGFGGGSGSVFRGGDTLASLAIDSSGYVDHGWFIVPSASAEYGDGHFDVAAADGADGFVFNAAAGEFTSDWFLV
jgi:hypothetical protein